MSNTSYSPTKAHLWNRLTCDAIQYLSLPATIASRALAMVHTAIYDAWTNYNIDGCEVSTSTGKHLQQPESQCNTANREKAYSHAAYTVLNELFWCSLPPMHKNMFREFMCSHGYDPDNKTLQTDTPEGVGNLTAKLILECFAGDHSNPHATVHQGKYSDFTNYKPVNPPVPQPLKHETRWQPQLHNHKPQQFTTPHWGLVKPFALNWGGDYRPSPPVTCTGAEFKKQIDEVLHCNADLTDMQKICAEFYAGMHEDKFADSTKDSNQPATPPEQYCRVARYLSKKYEYKNAYDVKLFFALANALHDTAIATWDSKVFYDYVRPISAIRDSYRGKTIKAWGGPCEGTQDIEGENWMPYLPTPSFAEYVSQNSTFGAAAEVVLCNFTNSNTYGESVVIPKGSSKIEPNCTPAEDITIEWKILKDFANQAGIAGVYGGINFTPSDMEGRKLGNYVGRCVWDKVQKYFNGELG